MKMVWISALLFTILLSSVGAAQEVGIGLRWTIEAMQIPDFKETCISYGIYNPFDVDVTAKLIADGDVKKLVTKSDEIFVPAHTGSANALPAEICFYPPLRFPPFYPKEYSGTVSAEYVTEGVEGTGSATGLSVQAPLKLGVGNMRIFIVFSTLIIIIVAALLFQYTVLPHIKELHERRKPRKGKIKRKKRK